MKEVGLIVDLYLSSVLKEDAVKRAVSDFYNPLIRLIKTKKDLKISLNIPLSTFELLDRYGFQDLILEIRDLYEKEKIEIVGSSPYNSVLTEFPKEFAESQIILNEYGLGYYLGSKQGFEGESSIMLRGLDGFIPADLAINKDLANILEDMGYKWIAVDYTSLSGSEGSSKGFLNSLDGSDIAILGVVGDLIGGVSEEESGDNESRDFQDFRNSLIQKIDGVLGIGDKSISSIYEKEKNKYSAVFKLGSFQNIKDLNIENDSFKKSYETIEILIDYLIEKKFNILSVNSLTTNQLKTYPKYNISNNIADTKKYDKESYLAKDFEALCKEIMGVAKYNDIVCEDDFSYSVAMWKDDEISKIEDSVIMDSVSIFILLSKLMCIDKYYCIREVIKKSLHYEECLSVLENFLSYAKKVVDYTHDDSSKDKLGSSISALSSKLLS